MAIELQCSYSTISAKELLAKVIPDYCIENPIECLFWERGTNDTYKVLCANARYSLRIYRHEIYPRDELDFEVDALNYLHKNGFPVAYPIERESGGYITEIIAPEGLRYVLVTAFAEGDEPKYDSLDDFRLTGESVAKLHQVSQGFESTYKKKNLDIKNFIDDSFNTIEPYLSHRPEKLSLMRQYIESSRSAIEEIDDETMDIGFCHGDIHGGNAHLHDGVLTHFDFEECGFGYRVFDLATFKWGFVFSNEAPERWAAFVEGYESIRKIGAADLQLLDTFMLLRHIWLISFHMRNAHDFSCQLISDDYIDRQWKTLKRLSSEGIGAEMKADGQYAVVVRVVAGGPAAISEQVNVNDQIVGVGNGENGEIIDTMSWSLDDVIDLIRGPIGSTVRLNILSANAPADSVPKVVALLRDKIRLQK